MAPNFDAPCRHWLEGRCNRSLFCRFRHDLQGQGLHSGEELEGPSGSTPASEPQAAHIRPVEDYRSRTPCIYRQYCRNIQNGGRCPFSHQAEDFADTPSAETPSADTTPPQSSSTSSSSPTTSPDSGGMPVSAPPQYQAPLVVSSNPLFRNNTESFTPPRPRNEEVVQGQASDSRQRSTSVVRVLGGQMVRFRNSGEIYTTLPCTAGSMPQHDEFGRLLKLGKNAPSMAPPQCPTRIPAGPDLQCRICLDQVSQYLRFRCSNGICLSCLELSSQITAIRSGGKLLSLCSFDHKVCAIPLTDLQAYLSTPAFEAMLKTVFISYIRHNSSLFHFCPTPDCEHVYGVTATSNLHTCAACSKQTCTACHAQHAGVDCEVYAAQQRLTEEYQALERATTELNVKPCPGCGTRIEKEVGCLHMLCVVCATSFCWQCRQIVEVTDFHGCFMPTYFQMEIDTGALYSPERLQGG